MTFGPEKVQDRLTRKPPPGRLRQHTPRRLPLQGKDFWGQKEILFLFLANLRCIVKILATAFPGMQKHLIANQTMKEFCESELCDLKFGCTWQIARCRISSMPPFNWHFLPPTVSCHFFSTPAPKNGIGRIIQRLLFVKDTFTSECFLLLCMPCLCSLSIFVFSMGFLFSNTF